MSRLFRRVSGEHFLCKKMFPGPLPKNSKLVLVTQSLILASSHSPICAFSSPSLDLAVQQFRALLTQPKIIVSRIRVFGWAPGRVFLQKDPPRHSSQESYPACLSTKLRTSLRPRILSGSNLIRPRANISFPMPRSSRSVIVFNLYRVISSIS